MLYTFLITIVFIAEIIILCYLLNILIKADKKIIEMTETSKKITPSIKDILVLIKGISEQLTILADDFIARLKIKQEDTTYKYLNRILIALILWKINSKAIKKFRRSKLAKTLSRGYNLLQSMV